MSYSVHLQSTVSLVMPAEPFLAAILVLAAIVDVYIQFLNRSATFWLIPRLLSQI